MRVAVVHSYYSSSTPSGENIAVDAQVAALRARGHDVHVFSRSTDDLQTRRSYPTTAALTVATGRGDSPLADVREFAPDVIHIHNLFPNFGDSWLRDAPAPIVATLHNFRPLCSAGTLSRDGANCTECIDAGSHRAVKHACYRGSTLATVPLAIATRGRGRHNAVLSAAARVVCLAPRSAETYRVARPDLADRIAMVPNFAADPGSVTLADSAAPWVFVGRLSEQKGVRELVASWKPSEPLRVVGSGPLEPEVRRLADGKRIDVVGPVSPEQVRQELRSSIGLVFASQSREGAAALTYIEAASEGRATLTTGENSVTDDVNESGSGVTTASIAELAEAAPLLRSRARELGATARERFLERFTEDAWVRSIEDVYADVTHN